jgi:hypothetical protein
MVAPSSKIQTGAFAPASQIKTTVIHYLDFCPGLRPMSGFAGSLSTVVVVVLPPLRAASEALVRSLAMCSEFEFLELGMILYLLVMSTASLRPHSF